MVLNTGLDSSFDNMQEWKGIWEKATGIKSTKVYITDENLPLISQWISQ
jgi:hypothetical protein